VGTFLPVNEQGRWGLKEPKVEPSFVADDVATLKQ
jgi:hypothetical protein